jgi:hypothetical protein
MIAAMKRLLGQGRWLYALALLQLLGGPSVVSVVVLLGESKMKDSLAVESGVIVACESISGVQPASSGEAMDHAVIPDQEPAKRRTSVPKAKPKWSVEIARQVRVFPPAPSKWAFIETRERVPEQGAGPPAPPPRWVQGSPSVRPVVPGTPRRFERTESSVREAHGSLSSTPFLPLLPCFPFPCIVFDPQSSLPP